MILIWAAHAGAPSDRPELIVFALARIFAARDGRPYHASAEPYPLKVQRSAGRYTLSGFGMAGESVVPYLTTRGWGRRALVFVSDDPRSEVRPTLLVDGDGFARLHTKRLRLAKLRLYAISELNRPFRAATIEANRMGLRTRGRARLWCEERLF